MKQTTEQKILTLIGFGCFLLFLLIFIIRDSGWFMGLAIFTLFGIFYAVVTPSVYREWSILAKGECCTGKIISYGIPLYYMCEVHENVEEMFAKYNLVEVEFYLHEERHTTFTCIWKGTQESLTSPECTVYCRKIRGKKYCIVRDFEYDKSRCSNGIPLARKRTLPPQSIWGLGLTDNELMEAMHKKLLRGNGADYRHLYK